MPLEDEEGCHLLGILVPRGPLLSPTWECMSDMQEEFNFFFFLGASLLCRGRTCLCYTLLAVSSSTKVLVVGEVV